jgi:putative ABC transport system permease protein
MRLLRTLAARVRALFRRDAVAGEIHEELEFHLTSRTEQYRSEGLAPDEAERKARERVGNLALHQDRGYDVRGGGFLETVLQDVKHGVRLLAKQPGFALVAILTIALGIGASTAIFSVIDAALLHPLPYPHPEQLVEVRVSEFFPDVDRVFRRGPSAADLRTWLREPGALVHVAAYRMVPFPRLVDGAELERLSVREMTEDYLQLHGVAPAQGRAFGADDMKTGAPNVVLLGHGYWQRRYGASPNAVGQVIRIDGAPTTVVGVLPRMFEPEVALWRPLRLPATLETQRGVSETIGRLRPSITIEAAARQLTAALPPGEPTRSGAPPPTVVLRSLLEQTAATSATTVNAMAGAVGLILLIACVNVAGLLLARGATRQPELAVRASLGAGRRRLLRQLLTENLVLSVAGGAVGVVLAGLTLDTIVANIPVRLPTTAVLNMRVLAAALILTVGTGVIFGLVPALRLSRVRLGAVLARSSRSHGSSLSRRGGQALIGAEIALAVVLLAGAGLMIRSYARLVAVDLGFDPDSFVTLDAMPVDPATQMQYYPALLETIRAIPGVASAGAADYVPLSGSSVTMGARLDTGESTSLAVRMILPGYFETIGIPIRQGRMLTDADLSSAQPVALINEAAARRSFPDSALGRRIEVSKISYEIIGVVGDLRHMGPADHVAPEIYRQFKAGNDQSRRAQQGLTVVVRPNGPVAGLAQSLRRAAASVGPRALVEGVRTGGELFGERVIAPRRQTVLLGLLGGLGLLLTLVGVLGVTAFAVARRTQEIGVRIAFGAQPSQVVGGIVRDAWLPIAIGLAAGLGGAYFATQLIKTFLFETTPTDPVTFGLAALALGAAATAAAWVPARRAARVDPVAALRAE